MPNDLVAGAAAAAGTRPELIEVLDLARAGLIDVETERFPLEDGPKAYERLRARTLRGRAVLVP